jgi:hypothetical protein
MAAAAAADRIALIIAGGAGAAAGFITRKRVGQTDISYANGRTESEYSALAKMLRGRGRTHQTLYAGGISVADKLLTTLDTDVPPGRIKLGQFDSPESIRED